MTFKLVYVRHALKDAPKLAAAGLKPKAQALLAILSEDPFRHPPPFESQRLDRFVQPDRDSQFACHIRHPFTHRRAATRRMEDAKFVFQKREDRKQTRTLKR